MKPERETNLKSLLVSGNELKVAGMERRGRDGVVGGWTLGRVYAMVSAVNCVRLMNHRPIPLKQIIHHMLVLKSNSRGAWVAQ